MQERERARHVIHTITLPIFIPQKKYLRSADIDDGWDTWVEWDRVNQYKYWSLLLRADLL